MIRHGLLFAFLTFVLTLPLRAQAPDVGHKCVSGCGGQSNSSSAEEARRDRQHADHMKREREWEAILTRWKSAADKGADYSRKGQKALAKGKCAEAIDSFQRELAAFQSVSTADLDRADSIWGLNRCIKEGGKTHCYSNLHVAQEQRVGWARERAAGAQAQCGSQRQALRAGTNGGAGTSSTSSQHASNSKSNSAALSHAEIEQQKRAARVREWNDQGSAAEARKNWHDAISDYKKALDASPGSPAALHNLARAQNEYALEAYNKGDYKNAIKYFEEAAKTSPTDPTIAANLRTAEEAKSRGKGSPKNAANVQPATAANGQPSPLPATGTSSGLSSITPAPPLQVNPNGTAMQQLQAIAGAPKEAPAASGVCRENCLPAKLTANPEALKKYQDMDVRRVQKQKEYASLDDKMRQIKTDMDKGNGNQAELVQQFSETSNQRTKVHAELAATETEMNSFLVSFQEEPAKANGEPDKKGTTSDQPK